MFEKQMTKKMNRKIDALIYGIILFLILLLSSFVGAFGVASPVWRGNPLIISPGDTKTVTLTLQNMVGNDDVRLRATITNGADIASTEEEDYLVKAQTADTRVPIKVSVPADYAVGNYSITVSFVTVTPSEEGAVFLGTGIDTTFDVSIRERAPASEEPQLAPPVKSNMRWYVIGAIILLIIIVVIIIIRKLKKR